MRHGWEVGRALEPEHPWQVCRRNCPKKEIRGRGGTGRNPGRTLSYTEPFKSNTSQKSCSETVNL